MEQTIEDEVITIEKDSDLHYAMVDGSYLLSRENGWTETKVGRVFKQEDNFAQSSKRNIIKASGYVAHIGNHVDFCEKFSPVLDKFSNVVFIADGATWFWNWVSTFYAQSIQILDFFHAYEKIGQWTSSVHEDKTTCSEWCEYAKKLLLDDQVSELIIQIQ